MRHRAIMTAIGLGLSAGASAFGCQYIAGITVLQVTGGTGGGVDGGGGAGGATTSHSSSSASSSSSTGGSCSMPSQCGADTDCQTFACNAGKCSTTNADLGTLCQGDAGDHVCDGNGACKQATCMDKVKDGDETDTDCGGIACGATCTMNQHCNGTPDCDNGYCLPSSDAGPAGLCKPLKALGSGCSSDDECGVGVAYCTGGVCCTVQSCEPYACSANGQCKVAPCGGSNDCALDSVCGPVGPGMMACSGCGAAPGMMQCTPDAMICESCVANVCVKTCDTPGECDGVTITLAMMMMPPPAKVLCNDQCNNTTITCNGPNSCEVDCGSGGCNGLTINCSVMGGKCTLTCAAGGCTGAGVTMSCGDNACAATCGDGAAVVDQKANSSCGAKKTGCQ